MTVAYPDMSTSVSLFHVQVALLTPLVSSNTPGVQAQIENSGCGCWCALHAGACIISPTATEYPFIMGASPCGCVALHHYDKVSIIHLTFEFV